MTDNTCGHPTGENTPCRNPAGEGGRCWIPSHNPDSDGENPQGRPSKFSDELAQEAIEAATEVYSYAGIERAIGVGQGTINGEGGWLDQGLTFIDDRGEERKFSQALERARSDGERDLIRGGLYDDGVDTSMAKFLLASSYGHKKTEKREHTGGGGGPVEVTFSEEVVETPWSEGQTE